MFGFLLSLAAAEVTRISHSSHFIKKGSTYDISGENLLIVVHTAGEWTAKVKFTTGETLDANAGYQHIIDFGGLNGTVTFTASENIYLQYSQFQMTSDDNGKDITVVSKIQSEPIESNNILVVASPYLIHALEQSENLKVTLYDASHKFIPVEYDSIDENFYAAIFHSENTKLKLIPIVDDCLTFKANPVTYKRDQPFVGGAIEYPTDMVVTLNLEYSDMVDMFLNSYRYEGVTYKSSNNFTLYFHNAAGFYHEEMDGHVLSGSEVKINFVNHFFTTPVHVLSKQKSFVNIIAGKYEHALSRGIYWFPTHMSHSLTFDIDGISILTQTDNITTDDNIFTYSGIGSMMVFITNSTAFIHQSNDTIFTGYTTFDSFCDNTFGLLMHHRPIYVNGTKSYSLSPNTVTIFRPVEDTTMALFGLSGFTVVVRGVEFVPQSTFVSLSHTSELVIKVFENQMAVAFAPSSLQCEDFLTVSGKYVKYDIRNDNKNFEVLNGKHVCAFGLMDGPGYVSVMNLGDEIPYYTMKHGALADIPTFDSSVNINFELVSRSPDLSGSPSTSIVVYSKKGQKMSSYVESDRPVSRKYFVPESRRIVDSMKSGEIVSIRVTANTNLFVQSSPKADAFVILGDGSRAPVEGKVFRFERNATLVFDALEDGVLLVSATAAREKVVLNSAPDAEVALDGGAPVWLAAAGDSALIAESGITPKSARAALAGAELFVNGRRFTNFRRKVFPPSGARVVSGTSVTVSVRTPVSIVDNAPVVQTVVETCGGGITADGKPVTSFTIPPLPPSAAPTFTPSPLPSQSPSPSPSPSQSPVPPPSPTPEETTGGSGQNQGDLIWGMKRNHFIGLIVGIILFVVIIVVIVVLVVKCKKKDKFETLTADIKVPLV